MYYMKRCGMVWMWWDVGCGTSVDLGCGMWDAACGMRDVRGVGMWDARDPCHAWTSRA